MDAEYHRRKTAQWQLDNPERKRAKDRRWKRNHADEVRANTQRRRALRISNGPAEVFSDIEIFERDEWICQLCREPIDPSLDYPDPMSKSLDHVVAIVNGGSHVRANVQSAHLRCNQVKGANKL